ncbi:MAG: hypothetical protein M9953_14535 [Thermomicrobiales bacterium]|nr:hypothetical protein [Thermomicrobiales bacterium]
MPETRIISASSEVSIPVRRLTPSPRHRGWRCHRHRERIDSRRDRCRWHATQCVRQRVNRETFVRGNQLWAYSDKPRAWDAWDIDETYETIGEEIGGIDSIEIVENGPLRVAARSRTFRTRYYSYRPIVFWPRAAASISPPRSIGIERLTLVRTQFPTTIHTHEATYETMYGVHKRATNRNNAWERARSRWVLTSSPTERAELRCCPLNNRQIRPQCRQWRLGMSLVRGPLHPDPFADEGHHEFTYSYFLHTGDWVEGRTQEALALNAPMVVTEVADASPIARS